MSLSMSIPPLLITKQSLVNFTFNLCTKELMGMHLHPPTLPPPSAELSKSLAKTPSVCRLNVYDVL